MSVSWRLRPGRPSGPSSRAGFPLRPRRLGGPGSAMNPVDPLSSPPGACSSRAPGCGGHFAAPVGFSGVSGACAAFVPAAPGGGAGSLASRLAASRRLPAGGKRVTILAGPPYELLAADSVALFRHLLPRSGVWLWNCPTCTPDVAAGPPYLARLSTCSRSPVKIVIAPLWPIPLCPELVRELPAGIRLWLLFSPPRISASRGTVVTVARWRRLRFRA